MPPALLAAVNCQLLPPKNEISLTGELLTVNVMVVPFTTAVTAIESLACLAAAAPENSRPHTGCYGKPLGRNEMPHDWATLRRRPKHV